MKYLEKLVIFAVAVVLLVAIQMGQANGMLSTFREIRHFLPSQTRKIFSNKKISSTSCIFKKKSKIHVFDTMKNEFIVIEVKRGPAIHSLTPAPRRRSDPDFAKWINEADNVVDDEFDGELNGNSVNFYEISTGIVISHQIRRFLGT